MTESGKDRTPIDHDVPDQSVDEDAPAMADVDHESPHSEGADRVFERGTEGRDDP